jgi:hypothetical protein
MVNSGNCIPQLQRRFSKSCGCNVMRTLIIVDVFDIRQNKLMENFKAHTLNTKSLSMDLLEQFAVSGASDGNIKVFFLLPVSSFSSVSTAFPLPFSFCVPFSPLFSFFFPSHSSRFSFRNNLHNFNLAKLDMGFGYIELPRSVGRCA